MTIISGIYEAAMLPEYWPTALQAVADHLAVEGCTLITIDTSPRWAASTRIEALCQDYIESGWHERNEPLERLLKKRPYGFIREIDDFTSEEVANLAIVRDYKRLHGFGWSAAMATPMPGGEMLLFSIEQLWNRGALTDGTMAELELLRPHISRAALLAAKLQHQRDEAAVHSLGLIGVSAAIVTLKGVVRAANDRFLSHGERLSVSAYNRLRIGFAPAAKRTEDALSRLSANAPEAALMSIAVPGEEDEAPLVLHILPVRDRARDIFGAATALVVVTSVSEGTRPSASLIRALFDLTPAEARVAEAIVAGRDEPRALQALGMGSETVRTHVKSIFRKTGLNSRLDLVRLLSTIGLPG
ncbi:DNA-binding CsgD family transcriptional regulator [Rhizobium sp. PP-F2F-G36]|nr:DNA-binding CsgD family transcriptional regulator [Rhizobium sp. PP-F2F-G36]